MKYATKLALFLASTFLIVLPARADVPPPETAPCSGKQAGAACTYNAAGVCQDGTCSRLDYANWDRDASASPPTASYACLKCVTGSVTATATGTGTGSDTGTGTGTGSKTTTDTGTATATPTATGTVTETNTPTATASDTDTVTGTPTITATATATTTTTTTTNPPTVSNTATSSNTATGTNGDEPPADDDGACSVGRGVSAKRVAPWLLAASFSLLFLFARRRRR